MVRTQWFRQVVPIVGALFITLPPGAPSAHEEGVLKPDRREFAPGDSVAVAGQKFSKRAELRLLLAGVHGRIELATVRTDTAGAFIATVRVPADAAPGAYRLIALATDDDEVATLDVTVVPAAAAAEHAAHDKTEAEPSHEPLELDRARHPLVTGGALVTIGLAFVFGVVLLRRPLGA